MLKGVIGKWKALGKAVGIAIVVFLAFIILVGGSVLALLTWTHVASWNFSARVSITIYAANDRFDANNSPLSHTQGAVIPTGQTDSITGNWTENDYWIQNDGNVSVNVTISSGWTGNRTHATDAKWNLEENGTGGLWEEGQGLAIWTFDDYGDTPGMNSLPIGGNMPITLVAGGHFVLDVSITGIPAGQGSYSYSFSAVAA